MTQRFIAPNATAPIVDDKAVLRPEWQNYLNGIQALSALLQYYAGSGAGSPEGVVVAPVGSIYTRTDGAAGTVLYIKEVGSADTGWAAK